MLKKIINFLSLYAKDVLKKNKTGIKNICQSKDVKRIFSILSEEGNENHVRFAFFCKSVLFSLKKLYWTPEVIISNDWQMSFVPILGKILFDKDDFYKNIKYVHIIHSYNDSINFNQESFESLGLSKKDCESYNNFLNPIQNSDFTVILNDINNPVIDKINKDSANKKMLKKAKHKVYDIDYTSIDYKDQINNVINDIRSL